MNTNFAKRKAAMLVLDNAHFAILNHLVSESRILFRYNTADVIAYKAELEREDMCYEEVVILDEQNMTVTIKVTPFQSIPATLRTALRGELMRDVSIGDLEKTDRLPPPVHICGNRLVAYEKINLTPNVRMLERELIQNSESYFANPKEYRCNRLNKDALPSGEDFDKALDRLLTPLKEICEWLEFMINRAVVRDTMDDECDDAWFEECSLDRSDYPSPSAKAELREIFEKNSALSDIEEELPY